MGNLEALDRNYSQKGKSVDFVRQIFAELAGNGNISFDTTIEYLVFRGICTTGFKLDIVKVFGSPPPSPGS